MISVKKRGAHPMEISSDGNIGAEYPKCSIHSSGRSPNYHFFYGEGLRTLNNSQLKDLIDNIKNIKLFEKYIEIDKTYFSQDYCFRHPEISLALNEDAMEISREKNQPSSTDEIIKTLKNLKTIHPKENSPLSNRLQSNELQSRMRIEMITSICLTCLECRKNAANSNLSTLPSVVLALIHEY
jgi:hypothetical protein